MAPGATVTFSFTVPKAGTYLYYNSLNAPVNRAMGLYGALHQPDTPVLYHRRSVRAFLPQQPFICPNLRAGEPCLIRVLNGRTLGMPLFGNYNAAFLVPAGTPILLNTAGGTDLNPSPF